MKCSENWLREWVNPTISRKELCHILTMGGLEVEEVSPVAEVFTGVVIGRVVAVSAHPKADKLKLCQVEIGQKHRLSIVCGADNVLPGLSTAVAIPGAMLPGKKSITTSAIRGVTSEGMLCSAFELGLSEDHDGIIELSEQAPIGEELWHYLKLEDYLFDINITPNRGDCLSVRGLAREVHALTHALMTPPVLTTHAFTPDRTFPLSIEDKKACPRYVGRVIKNITADAETPIWLSERLRRSGIRSISVIVDIANYVMLELGQPMHAFDLDKLDHEIIVRRSKTGEQIALLDGSQKVLDNETLVIADRDRPHAIAGVMGGLESSVTLLTKNIFLESAFFDPKVVARQRQFYNLNSDSAHRFERGVDPSIQEEAIERATQLILSIAGGEAGPIIAEKSEENIPNNASITLQQNKVDKVLGISIPSDRIEQIFTLLAMQWRKLAEGTWEVKAPSYRFDIALAEDLIEEIARLYGYNNIPTHQLASSLEVNAHEDKPHQLKMRLYAQGFHEVISYSFVEKRIQAFITPQLPGIPLLNPINAELAVMRTSLWPGLLTTYLYNQSRQQSRVRLFEVGTCFRLHDETIEQTPHLAGLLAGPVYHEQWGINDRDADFFDLKGHIEALFQGEPLTFRPSQCEALHPGQSASIYYQDQKIGEMGLLHPEIKQALDVTAKLYLFEIDLASLPKQDRAPIQEVSKFPEIRRDLAFIVDEAIPAKEIQDTIRLHAGDWLKELFIFDVYRGKGIAAGKKSIAFALILQNQARTLIDVEVADLLQGIIIALKEQLGAELRSNHDANKSGSSETS